MKMERHRRLVSQISYQMDMGFKGQLAYIVVSHLPETVMQGLFAALDNYPCTEVYITSFRQCIHASQELEVWS